MNPVADPFMHPAWYIAFSATLALVPLILGTTTSYLKISMALGVLRNGFGAQQVPNNTVIMVLALVLSLFIMQPTAEQVLHNVTREPKFDPARASIGELSVYGGTVLRPWRSFLRQHSGEREIAVLSQIGHENEIASEASDSDGPTLRILIPAFLLTELKEGLMIGFMLLLPFLVIDLAVANILAGLGMYMMSPTIISLPLKLLLFVSVDGWLLISRGFIASYGAAA